LSVSSIDFAIHALSRQTANVIGQHGPQWLNRPAGTIAVVSLDPQRCALTDEIAQHIAIAFKQIGEGSQTEALKHLLAHLPFDAPGVARGIVKKKIQHSLPSTFLEMTAARIGGKIVPTSITGRTDMKVCKDQQLERRRQRIQRSKELRRVRQKLHLLNAVVAALQDAGLMERAVIERARQECHRHTKSPRA